LATALKSCGKAAIGCAQKMRAPGIAAVMVAGGDARATTFHDLLVSQRLMRNCSGRFS